jgi:hypothetical protein
MMLLADPMPSSNLDIDRSLPVGHRLQPDDPPLNFETSCKCDALA